MGRWRRPPLGPKRTLHAASVVAAPWGCALWKNSLCARSGRRRQCSAGPLRWASFAPAAPHKAVSGRGSALTPPPPVSFVCYRLVVLREACTLLRGLCLVLSSLPLDFGLCGVLVCLGLPPALLLLLLPSLRPMAAHRLARWFGAAPAPPPLMARGAPRPLLRFGRSLRSRPRTVAGALAHRCPASRGVLVGYRPASGSGAGRWLSRVRRAGCMRLFGRAARLAILAPLGTLSGRRSLLRRRAVVLRYGRAARLSALAPLGLPDGRRSLRFARLAARRFRRLQLCPPSAASSLRSSAPPFPPHGRTRPSAVVQNRLTMSVSLSSIVRRTTL